MEKEIEIKSVLLINDTFPPLLDGVSNTVINYQKVLIEEYGIHAVVLTPFQEGIDYEKYPYPVYPYKSLDTTKKIEYRSGIPFSPRILKELKKNPPQIIHAHCPLTAMTMSMELRKIFKCPIVLTYHTKFNIDVRKRVKSNITYKLACNIIKAQLNSADEIWSVSKPTGENLKAMGYKRDYLVMENGIDMPNLPLEDSLVNKYTQDIIPNDGRLIFLFVGRQFWYKGIKITLDALVKLKNDGINFSFISIGDGSDSQDIKNYVKEIGLEDNVIFLSSINNREVLRAFYTRADLFILPSTYDCNPLVVLEASANHTASILVRNSDSSIGKTDKVNTFFIDENDQSLYETLLKLSKNKELITKVGQKASEDLYVSWSDAVKNGLNRYKQVIQNYQQKKYPKHRSLYNLIIKAMGLSMNFFSLFARKMKKKTS